MRKPGMLTAPALGLLLATGLWAGGSLPVRAADRSAAVVRPHSGTRPPAAVRPHTGTGLRATLANGLRVVIVRDTLAPMVTTQITYLAGSYEAPPGFPGTAHALEHMMFRDSRGMTGAQLNEMTGKMGATNNAFTTNDATQFYFVAPAQYLDILLHIEATRMRGAKLSDSDWDLEKGAIEQEVSRDISEPSYLAFTQAEQILYAGTGYAQDALGSRPSFDKTTGAILQRFYDHWYVPNNAILVIVGNVHPEATLSEVKALFGPVAKGVVPARAPVELGPLAPRTIAKTTPDATGLVQFMYRMPGMRSPDYAAVQVLMDVLNNARSALSDLAAKGEVLFADAGVQSFTHGGVGVVEAGFPKGSDGKQAAHALDGVIAGFLKNGVPADLVEAAKRQERAQFEFARNSAVGLASAWSQALAWQGVDSPREALEQIEKVSVSDVDRVARLYLKPAGRVTVVLTPSPSGKRPPNSAGFGGTETFASNDKLNVPLPEWASKALARLEMPHWT
ncbi:MAG: M16 family metallopeptidase, partial [Steroidobacteraceae bacterium]